MTGERDGSSTNVAGYVLAGGASSRFGGDKALAKLGGIPMLEYMIDLLIKVTGDAFIVGGTRKQYQGFDVDIIADRWPREGPLGGIVTALDVSAKSPGKPKWNLVVSCDMPFLTHEWLDFLVGRAWASEVQVVLAHSAQGPEPLCAVWRTDACDAIREQFESGVRKVTAAIAKLNAEVLDEADWKRFDSAGRLFWNMNTAADYEEARRIVDAER
ncbi:MAG: molybdenum cofactor guanylyltransferase [Candidatus Acidiferrum sp.]